VAIGQSKGTSDTIKAAFDESIRQAALKSTNTLLIVELTRKHVRFRISLTAMCDHLAAKREGLRRRANDYFVDTETYGEHGYYRNLVKQSKQRLWAETDALSDELRLSRKKAKRGEVTPMSFDITEQNLQSLAEAEWRQITFVFYVKFLSQIQIKAGRTLS
jgi:hypothetical protein